MKKIEKKVYRLIMILTLVLLTVASVYGERVKLCDEIGVRPYTRINNRFGKLLLDVLSKNAGNLFFSPSSLSSSLSAVYYGAKGETSKNLTDLAYLSLQYENASMVTSRLVYCLQLLYNLESISDEYTLERANAMFIQQDFHVLNRYKHNVSKTFGAMVKEIDFAGHIEKVVEEMNFWVKEKTHNEITKLLDNLDASTRLLLVSAIYFKGTWRMGFNHIHTKLRPFYNKGIRLPKSVPTMKLHATLPYFYDSANRYRALQLPYKGNDTSMIVLLPFERDGLEKLQQIITLESILNLLDSLNETEVTVSLPKFKIEYSRKMRDDLADIGLGALFAREADFSGITGIKNVCVSDVVHKAIVEVNEEGGETDAGNGEIIYIMKPPEDPRNEFIADHPFLFFIVDDRSGSNLFVGRVSEL